MSRVEDEPITTANIPSQDEMERFERTKLSEHGPTIPHLRLDIATSKLASEWNKRAVRIFAKYYREQQDYSDGVTDIDVRKTFMTHLQTLHRHFEDHRLAQNPTPSAQQNKLDKARLAARSRRHRGVRNLIFPSICPYTRSPTYMHTTHSSYYAEWKHAKCTRPTPVCKDSKSCGARCP